MCNKEILYARAEMLSKARAYFSSKKILEIDTPALTKNPSIDVHIDVMQTFVLENETGYLHTSPEYLMKRLIAEGLGDIFFLGHVFRKGEIGDIHNPEFSMAEWYRKKISYDDFIDEVVEFINLFIPAKRHTKKSYRKTLFDLTGIDYLETDIDTLQKFSKKHISLGNDSFFDKDTLLNLIMTHLVEPHLGNDELFILNYYPASQAALAKTKKIKDEEVAERFEIYYKGIELANGFHELEDSLEQEKRFIKANEERKKLNKEQMPIDRKFLQALKKGLGDCCGVAVGFDRLLMLKLNKSSLQEILPFSWNET